ncbi:MAG: HEPN domain-containing protein [Saprospiraceae bacterium]|nr:HEPN domain-containing protein [Saprospiraceae bacterium]
MTAQNPHDWLIKAERDLGLAQDAFQMDKDYWDIICYHCQQATEKFFKAYLIHFNITFPRTHDLELLLNLMATHETLPPDFLENALAINDYSVHVRYPGFPFDPSNVEAADAISIAKTFRQYVLQKISPTSVDEEE